MRISRTPAQIETFSPGRASLVDNMLPKLVVLMVCCGTVWPGPLYSYINEKGIRVFSNIGADRPGLGPVPAAIPAARTTARSRFLPLIQDSASRFGLDPNLIQAVVEVESSYNPSAVSPKGCIGLMQLHPDTARRFGVQDSFNARENIQGGTQYLNFLMELFEQDLPRVLAAYNAGENAVIRHQGIPPYPETRRYVERVLSRYERFSGARPFRGTPRTSTTRLRRIQLPDGRVLFTNLDSEAGLADSSR